MLPAGYCVRHGKDGDAGRTKPGSIALATIYGVGSRVLEITNLITNLSLHELNSWFKGVERRRSGPTSWRGSLRVATYIAVQEGSRVYVATALSGWGGPAGRPRPCPGSQLGSYIALQGGDGLLKDRPPKFGAVGEFLGERLMVGCKPVTKTPPPRRLRIRYDEYSKVKYLTTYLGT